MKQVRKPTKKSNSGLYQSSTLLSTPLATAKFGQFLLKQALPHVWLLRGPLGAGKTTLVRGVLRALGLRQRVTSPTFTLVKIYKIHRRRWNRVVHVDAYRIKNPREFAALDIAEAMHDQKTLVLIEWPQRLG